MLIFQSQILLFLHQLLDTYYTLVKFSIYTRTGFLGFLGSWTTVTEILVTI